MSGMSHQEEWMPSMVKVILPIQDGDYTDGEIQRAFWLVGLRAQIAVLEEMNERLGGYSKSVEGYCASKIAALRKELKG